MTRFDTDSLLTELTLDEKASLATGSGFWHTRAIDRVGIPSIMVSDGPHGLRKQPGPGDHVGLGESVPATCFPPAVALGSSWDRALVQRVGVAIGEEAQAQGIAVVLGPGINIKRSPLCGRNFEYLSEDPYVSGVLGAAFVDGVQSTGIGTSLKHYAVNNQETDRLRVSAQVGDRALREVYLAGFERVVREAAPWTVMCSYNRINGVYASQDPWLLTTVLRDDWGFDGLVMSDWGAVDDRAAALAAGLDLEMPSSKGIGPSRVVAAVRAGELEPHTLDSTVARVLQLLDRAHDGDRPDATFDVDAHHALARAAAADCVVLLKNDGDVLPLGRDHARVAVIGELARSARFQGAGSSKVNPTRVDDALTALGAALGDDIVAFAPGYGLDDPDADAAALLDEARTVVEGADRVVVFLGLPASAESEGFDRTHIDLPAEQLAVLEAVAAVHGPVVVVLTNGAVVATDPWEHHAAAILEGWLAGQAGGSAIADVLVGDVNPSGRLAETIPMRLSDTPSYLSFPGECAEVVYGEGIHIGYRWYDAVDRPVRYPFGHGLSYTTFAHAALRATVLNAPERSAGWQGARRVEVSVEVTNTGDRAGKEVVQLYVGALDAASQRPPRELKGFDKVDLEPGASTTVTFTLTERDLSCWSTRSGDWVLEPGRFEVAVGASSRDLRCVTIVQIDGPPPVMPLDRSSTLGEWLEHPVGREQLLAVLRAAPGGDLSPLVASPERVRVIASFPMPRLLTMLGGAAGAAMIDELLDGLA